MVLCKKPYFKGVLPIGCGQCMPCRVKKSWEWTGRLLLERDYHRNVSFVTLTYRSEELNDVSSVWCADRPVVPTLVPRDAKNFLRRLRREVGVDHELRYFLTGEYGSIRERPHYHAAIFGLPSCVNGSTTYVGKYDQGNHCCANCTLLHNSWGKGRIESQYLSDGLAQYITKYITKKWTKEDKWTLEKLKGRYPEFVRMSNRPGIGADAIRSLITSTEHTRREKYLKESFDAPAVFQRGMKKFPLGKYLRGVWREQIGRGKDAPAGALEQYRVRMQELQREEREKATNENVPLSFQSKQTLQFLRTRQNVINFEARQKIYSNGGSL